MIMTYTYVVVDDDKIFRERIIATVEEFNKCEEIQTYFKTTYPNSDGMQLKFYAQHEGMDNNVLRNMNDADITFLDLRYGGDNEVGIHLLNLLAKGNHKRVIVVTGYKAEYENKAENYPQVLDWMHKPISLENLRIAIDKFYIQNENIAAVYQENSVKITGKNGCIIPYDEIVCAKSGGREVILFLTDGTSNVFSANTLSIARFENRSQLRRVSASFLINLKQQWRVAENPRGSFFATPVEYNFPELIEIERKITHNFLSVILQIQGING
jgi:DNA-binding LytR/AlgR family response regulator